MSEWDFTWGLSGEELDEALSSGATKEEWDEIEKSENKRIKDKLNSKKPLEHKKRK